MIKKTILNDKLILGSKKAQKFLEKLCLSKKHKIYIYTYPIIGVVNPTWNEFSNLYTSDWLFDIFSLTESEAMEAQALYDFNARSAREVNFHKGDTLVLFKQVSNDWWKGSVRGQEGLIPDKYIMLKMRYVNIFFVKLMYYFCKVIIYLLPTLGLLVSVKLPSAAWRVWSPNVTRILSYLACNRDIRLELSTYSRNFCKIQ